MPKITNPISDFDAGLLMKRIIGVTKGLMYKDGYARPTAFFLNEVNENKKLVLKDNEIVHNQEECLEISDLYKDQKKPIVGTVSVFRSQSLEDDKVMNNYIVEACKTNQPDMVAICYLGLYREVPEKDFEKEKERYDIGVLVDSVHILYAMYYLRGKKIARLMYIPYVNRGTLSESEITEDVKYDISFPGTGWIVNNDKEHMEKFPYPY